MPKVRQAPARRPGHLYARTPSRRRRALREHGAPCAPSATIPASARVPARAPDGVADGVAVTGALMSPTAVGVAVAVGLVVAVASPVGCRAEVSHVRFALGVARVFVLRASTQGDGRQGQATATKMTTRIPHAFYSSDAQEAIDLFWHRFFGALHSRFHVARSRLGLPCATRSSCAFASATSAFGSRAASSSPCRSPLRRARGPRPARSGRPVTWATSGSAPDGVPAIAIPFYLAHPRLKQLELHQMMEVEGGTPDWCAQLLRHECGHAFDHAYRFSSRRKWRARLRQPGRGVRAGDVPPAPVQPELRPPPAELVRAGAPRRGLRRDVRGLALDRPETSGARATADGRRSRSSSTSTR